MNTTLFYLRYAITGLMSIQSLSIGPIQALVVFVVANILWTWAEESLINRRNIRQTSKYRKKLNDW